MKYNSKGFLKLITDFEDIQDGIKDYLGVNLNKEIFYSALTESCKLDDGFINDVNKYIALANKIKDDYISAVENSVDDELKRRFIHIEEQEDVFFEEYCEKLNISKKDYFFLYYLLKLIVFKEENVYYFELNSLFGYQAYPILASVERIIKDYSESMGDEYSVSKISMRYSKNELETDNVISDKFLDLLMLIIKNKDEYKK